MTARRRHLTNAAMSCVAVVAAAVVIAPLALVLVFSSRRAPPR